MSDYYQSVTLNLEDVDELHFSFYYDSKHHRYRILIEHEERLNVTRKEGETILAFLRILDDLLGSRRKLRTPGSTDLSKDVSQAAADQEVDNSFDYDPAGSHCQQSNNSSITVPDFEEADAP